MHDTSHITVCTVKPRSINQSCTVTKKMLNIY